MNQPESVGGAPQGPPPSEEEMRAQLEAELKRLRVDDVLLQTVVSLLNLGARRAGLAGDGDDLDLEQVQSAVEAVQALLPVLERRAEVGDLRPVRDALAQLQLAYAQRRGGAPSPSEPAGLAGDEGADEQPPEQPPDAPGPAQSSGRLWVPGQ